MSRHTLGVCPCDEKLEIKIFITLGLTVGVKGLKKPLYQRLKRKVCPSDGDGRKATRKGQENDFGVIVWPQATHLWSTSTFQQHHLKLRIYRVRWFYLKVVFIALQAA